MLRFHVVAAVLTVGFAAAFMWLFSQPHTMDFGRGLLNLGKLYAFALICAFFALRKRRP